MRNIAGNRVFNMILLFTIIGEFIVPWILERFYSEYNGKIMVMSVLGSPQSPVRLVYNIWLIWLGGFLAYTAGVYFLSLRAKFPVLAVFMLLSIGIFAVGAGLISGFFSVNESKDIVTTHTLINNFEGLETWSSHFIRLILDNPVYCGRNRPYAGQH